MYDLFYKDKSLNWGGGRGLDLFYKVNKERNEFVWDRGGRGSQMSDQFKEFDFKIEGEGVRHAVLNKFFPRLLIPSPR